MKRISIEKHLIITLLAGIGCMTWLLLIPGDPESAVLWGFSKIRLFTLAGFWLGIFITGVLWIIVRVKGTIFRSIKTRIDRLLDNPFLLAVGWFVVWAGLFYSGYFLVYTFTNTNTYLSGFFTRLAPPMLWASVIFGQAVIFLWRPTIGNQTIPKNIRSEITRSTLKYDLRSHRATIILILLPILIMVMDALLWKFPNTQDIAVFLMGENHPVEFITFLSLFFGGVQGIMLASRANRWGEQKNIVWFYLVFSIGLIIVAMEEISWGQILGNYRTPEILSNINQQGEINLHNIGVLQGKSDYFLIIFALAGLIGVLFHLSKSFKKIATPVLLTPWFLTILTSIGVSITMGLIAGYEEADLFMDILSELSEMLVGITGALYIALNGQMLSYGRLRITRATNLEFETDQMIVYFDNGRTLFIPRMQIKALSNHSIAVCQNWELLNNGLTIHWPDLDLKLSLDDILGGNPEVFR